MVVLVFLELYMGLGSEAGERGDFNEACIKLVLRLPVLVQLN